MKYITPEQLAIDLKNQKSLILLDIRENYEYEVCNIQSLHIPMADIPVKGIELKPDDRTVVICRTGSRASAVANYLEANFGFQNVEVLEGGILAYAERIDKELDTEY